MSIRVLIADDQPIVRTGLTMLLDAQPDIEVVGAAADGREAVRLALQLRPDVGLFDIRMPLMDGIEATRRLAGPDVTDPLPIVVITTFDLDEYVHGALKAGALLQLAFTVSRVTNGACTPLTGAHIDIWHCDGLGLYSDVTDPRFDTVGQKFLRGYQVTDPSGRAQFTTIYPGWYQGRAVHIHFKIRTNPSSAQGHEFISQLYFDDALTDRVHALAPYASKGQRTVRNTGDGIFRRGGQQLMLAVAERDQEYAATFDIGLQLP